MGGALLVLTCEQLYSLRRQFSLILEPSWVRGGGQPPPPHPGNLRAQRPGSLFLLHSDAMAVNCRVWCSCHICVEAVTCDRAARVPLPAHPTGSHFVATVPLGTRAAADICSELVCVVPSGHPFPFPGQGLLRSWPIQLVFPVAYVPRPRSLRTLPARGSVIEKY